MKTNTFSIQNRSQKWDNLKFILIFLVVLGHVADRFADVSYATGCLRFIIYSFHMPAFIFVSGLFGKKNIDEKRWNNLASYLVLYLIIHSLIFISRWAANGTKPAFKLFSTSGAAWYILALFFFSIITMLTKNAKPSALIIFWIILACIAGYDNSIGDFLCLSRVIAYYPFYYLGYILNPKEVEVFFEKRKWQLRIISAILLAAGIIIAAVFYDSIKDIKFIFTGRNSYSVIKPNCPYAFTFRLICYAVSAVMTFCVISLTPSKTPFGHLSRWGAKSLQVYAVHYPLMVLLLKFVSEKYNLPAYFVSKLPLYEILIAVLITAVCLLPFWGTALEKAKGCLRETLIKSPHS
ncbi:MAG: acyltransferase family protein [Clostridiales bacterium]|nr:acyltransferase family protein [Clostridiales bacterium]